MKKFGIAKKKVAWVLGVSLLMQSAIFHINPTVVKAAEAATDLKLEAKSAILMEASTGQILYENNADVALPPASMAKMMTEYLVMDNINSGKIKWEDMVTASPYAAAVIGSGQLIASGEKLSVKDMFAAMSIYSANDASVALAEHIGGTEENFANMMNAKAKELGLSDQAHFIGATGLSRADVGKNAPAGIPGETIMSAKDAAILAYHVINDHKEILNFTKITSQKLRPTDKSPMINWNWMLDGNQNNVNFKKYAYPGLDGLKTGHTAEAGYCFTATAERSGMRLIGVVMGTATEPKRFEESRKLLDYGFTNFEIKPILNAKAEIDSLKSVNIKKGITTVVPLVTKTGLTFVAKKGAKADEFKISTAPVEEAKLVAPIKKGDKLGTVTISYNGKNQSTDLIANEDVEKASSIRLIFRAINNFFGDIFSRIKGMFGSR